MACPNSNKFDCTTTFKLILYAMNSTIYKSTKFSGPTLSTLNKTENCINGYTSFEEAKETCTANTCTVPKMKNNIWNKIKK